MSLLTICNALAKNVGMAETDVVATSSFRQWKEALQFANETGEELARRVDWGQLQESVTLAGTGAHITFNLPPFFARLNQGVAIMAGSSIVRPLTRAEWSRLAPVAGVPRYFLLEGKTLTLWPYLPDLAEVVCQYQSSAWCSNGTAGFLNDTDTALIDEELLTKGLIARWRRQKGMPYADEEAEYEAALRDQAGFNDRSRF